MTIRIYSDPHLGKTLASHTTPNSRNLFRDYIAKHTLSIAVQGEENDTTLCAGDLFDKHSNTEDVIVSAFKVVSHTSKVLSGNHDAVNIAGKVGSMDILASVFDAKIVPCRFGKPNYQTVCASIPVAGSRVFYMVPHHSDQNLFEKALEMAYTSALKSKKRGERPIMVAHCNYQNEHLKDGITLNMSSRRAEKLLEVFEYVILGHEHQHRVDHDGRLIIVGSPHPTNFGDISDKYIVKLDETTGPPHFEKVWSEADYYVESDYRSVAANVTDLTQFIKITGEINPSEVHELAKTVKFLWKNFKPFAIKSEVKIVSGDESAGAYDTGDAVQIQALIEKELKGSPELYKLWKEITDGDQ